MLGSLEYLVDNSLLFIYQKVKSREDPSENTMWGRDLGCIKAFWQDLDWVQIPAFEEALCSFGNGVLMWSCM